MPSICLEAFATIWLHAKKRIMREPTEEQIFTAQDNLQQCKKSMEQREKELQELVVKNAKEALIKKKAGDLSGARQKMRDRTRNLSRLQKLQNTMSIINAQLDAIISSELDKEVMHSLKASSEAMKKAGIASSAVEAENVMSELDDHIRDLQETSTALAAPIGGLFAGEDEDSEQLDKELEELMFYEENKEKGLSNAMYGLHPTLVNKIGPIKEEVASSTSAAGLEAQVNLDMDPGPQAQELREKEPLILPAS